MRSLHMTSRYMLRALAVASSFNTKEAVAGASSCKTPRCGRFRVAPWMQMVTMMVMIVIMMVAKPVIMSRRQNYDGDDDDGDGTDGHLANQLLIMLILLMMVMLMVVMTLMMIEMMKRWSEHCWC